MVTREAPPRRRAGDPKPELPEPKVDIRMLTLLLVLLVAIPSILIVGPLGAAGTPADILGLLLLLIWSFRRVASHTFAAQANSVRLMLFLFVASVVISYLAAATRPTNATELSAADRAVLSSLAWLGMGLFTLDGPTSLRQLDVFLRRLTIAGALEACVGIAQRFTHQALVNNIVIPGLKANASLEGALGTRGDQTRPPGTTIHAIEFGAVLTMILPLAVHYALYDTHRTRLRRWLPVLLIAFAVPISISRSAIVSLAVALIFLIPGWPASRRRRSYGAILVVAGVVYFVVPGLLGTLKALFLGIGNDTSAASRTGDFKLAESFISRAPVFGRGYGTFLPTYRILDDQLLGTVIAGGIVGLIALLALMVVPIVAAHRVRRRSTDDQTRDLALALAASVAAASISFALYDALSFPMAASLFFILIGAVGCLVRIRREESVDSLL